MNMAVYLLHSEEKLAGHAGHYCGWSDNLPARIACHEHGNSSKLVAAWSRNSIRFVVARVWLDGTREDELHIKRAHNGPRFCPICRHEVHPGYAVDIKQLLFQKEPTPLAEHIGKRRPMKPLSSVDYRTRAYTLI